MIIQHQNWLSGHVPYPSVISPHVLTSASRHCAVPSTIGAAVYFLISSDHFISWDALVECEGFKHIPCSKPRSLVNCRWVWTTTAYNRTDNCEHLIGKNGLFVLKFKCVETLDCSSKMRDTNLLKMVDFLYVKVISYNFLKLELEEVVFRYMI